MEDSLNESFIFEENDYEDVVTYCDIALKHLFKYSMPVGSRLYMIYSMFRLIKEFAKSST